MFAVDLAVLREAGELRVEREVALRALETADVPLFVDGQQVVPLEDLVAARRTPTRLRVRLEQRERLLENT